MSIFGTRKEPNLALVKRIDSKLARRVVRPRVRFTEEEVQEFAEKAAEFFEKRLEDIRETRDTIHYMDQSSYGAVDGHHGLNQFLEVVLELALKQDNMLESSRALLGVPKPLIHGPTSYLLPSTYSFCCSYSFDDFAYCWNGFFEVFIRCACRLDPGTKQEYVQKIADAHLSMMIAIASDSYTSIADYPAADHFDTDDEISSYQAKYKEQVEWAQELISGSEPVSRNIAEILYDEFISLRRGGRVKRFEAELDRGVDHQLWEFILRVLQGLGDEFHQSQDELAVFLVEYFEMAKD